MQVLSKHKIACTLASHGIKHRTDENGTLLALSEYTQHGEYKTEWIDTTLFTRHDLMNYLGYDILEEDQY